MKLRHFPYWKTLGIGVVIAFPGMACAGTSTGSFNATASVSDSCIVSATDLAFGSFAAADNNNVDASSTVSVTCSTGVTFEIALDEGLFSSLGTVLTRRMNDGGANYLSYQMYRDINRLNIWGQTTLVDVVTGSGDGSNQALTVYGRIPLGQTTAATGNYTDTITVSVIF